MKTQSVFFAAMFVLGLTTLVHAQGTGQNMYGGGAASGGGGVTTGVGPLNQPVMPAPSSANPRQNMQQNTQRPQNMPGPVQTNPGQNPFGQR